MNEESITLILDNLITDLRKVQLKLEFEDLSGYIEPLAENIENIKNNLNINKDELYTIVSIVEDIDMESMPYSQCYFKALDQIANRLSHMIRKMSTTIAYRKRVKTPLPHEIVEDRRSKLKHEFVESVEFVKLVSSTIKEME
tara:strand:+ start:887 stop:1312 length:426 start_codon:yes stop_codon:yes gene_type:complete